MRVGMCVGWVGVRVSVAGVRVGMCVGVRVPVAGVRVGLCVGGVGVEVGML